MSEKLFSVGEKLYELWSHRAKKLNNVKESGTKFFIEYTFVPVINSKQYHVRQRIENLICQSDLILHSLLMLECKKMLSSDNNLS